MMNKNILFLLIAALCFGAANAQTARPADFREQLGAPSTYGSRTRVTMSPELSAILDRPQSLDGKQVEGYRVYIYNENHQSAGAQAQSTLARFRSLFPDIPAEIIKRRDSPYWKVAVGGSLSRDEVMMVFGRVKESFPGAYTPAAERLPLKSFLIEPALPEESGAETPADSL